MKTSITKAFLPYLAVVFMVACGDSSSTNADEGNQESELSSASEESSSSTISSPSENSVSSENSLSSAASSSSTTSSESHHQETNLSSATVNPPEEDKELDPWASAKDWQDTCVITINQFRATENLPPLVRYTEKEACVNEQSAKDAMDGTPHGTFRYCDEYGQNSAPNIGSINKADGKGVMATKYLKLMWDEKDLITAGIRDPNKDEDKPYVGHYLNMSSQKFKKVACGYGEFGGYGWLNIDFYY